MSFDERICIHLNDTGTVAANTSIGGPLASTSGHNHVMQADTGDASRPHRGERRFGAPFWITFWVSLLTWAVLSGKFDMFHMSLGVISSVIVARVSGARLVSPKTGFRWRVWWRFICYIPWLLFQIYRANLHVMYLVFHPRMHELIDPRMVRFNSRLSTDMALFVLANSITLTPGTITVFTSVLGKYTVHVIDAPSAEGMPGEMEVRVAHIFEEL